MDPSPLRIWTPLQSFQAKFFLRDFMDQDGPVIPKWMRQKEKKSSSNTVYGKAYILSGLQYLYM